MPQFSRAPVLFVAIVISLCTRAAADEGDPYRMLSESPIKAKIINIPGSPVTIDSCRAVQRLYGPQAGPLSGLDYFAWVTLHNSGTKTIELIGVELTPRTAFDDSAGNAKGSLLAVDLAPGESMPEDYKFTDGAKEPLAGGVANEWSGVYEIDCYVSRVRFSDGTIYRM